MKIKYCIYILSVLLFQTVFVFGQPLSPNTSGSFVFTPTGPLSSKPITVYYYIPNGNISTMPILMSFHGDERNGSSYRDYWISMANANGFMVFAPEYSETYYPGGDGYQLGNVFVDGDNPSPATLNATNLWTFSTVDPLFESIKTRVSGTQQTYDAWGHSGGSQFLQRFRMYLPNSKLNTAICSNAGWYTVPESAINFPYGINNGQLSNGNLTIAFSKKLIVHLGVDDTDPNSPGIRHNTTVDNQQGLFRLARGRYFFNKSLTYSQTLSNTFNWQREEVTGVGHDPQLMANDALRFLFQTNTNTITYSILDGGFENQTAGTVQGGSVSAVNLSTTNWSASTTSGAAIVRTILASGGRSGPQCASFGSLSTTAKTFYTPVIAGSSFASNTKYQIQFFYKPTTTTGTITSSTVDMYINNESLTAAPASVGTKAFVATGLTSTAPTSSWTRVAVEVTSAATIGTNGLAAITFSANPVSFTASFDDFVIYQANSPDNIAPNSPGAITATGAINGAANISWGAASGGIDGGGYMVVRYGTNAPSSSDDPLQNGIYKFNNPIGAGVVRYAGAGTSFTDNGLSPGVDYYYKVYTVDKAFNYSDESTSSPVQALATTYYYKGTGLLTDLASWGQNTDGTGTVPTSFTTTSQVFEIRNTTAVTLNGTWTVGSDPSNGTKVRIGNTNQPAITLTLNSGASIGPSGTGNVDVMSPISGNQKVIYYGTTAISFGNIFDTNLEVVYDGISVSSSTTKSFGTITIINGANVTFTNTVTISNLYADSNSIVTFSSLPIVINTTVNGTLVAPTTNSSFITIPSAGSLTVNGIIKIPRLSGFVSSNLGTANTTTTGTNIQFLGTENLTLGANSTVEYIRDAIGPQIVTARTDYKNLKFSGTVPKNINGPTIVAGTLTVNQSAPATAVTMNGDLTVNDSLSFVLGRITTGNNTLTIGTSGTITGADQSTGWVVGNLKKLTASSQSPSFTYDIGDATNYTPLVVTFTGNTSVSGGLTAKINTGDHPQIASSGLNSAKSVNKTWTLTNDALVDFGTYSAAFSYTSGDIDISSTPSNYKVGLYSSSTWSLLTTLATPPPFTTTTATGISGFGDFAIGEPSISIVNLTLFIEGYYIGGNTMNSVKYNQDGSSPTTDVEDITVELHDAATYALVPGAITTATLKTNGAAICTFATAPSGSFYIAVKTSNTIQTWSATPQTVGSVPLNYDFSTAANKAYGDAMLDLGSGVFGFYSGDINQDDVIDGSDATNLDDDVFNSEFGVRVTDLNGDGSVDGSDTTYFANNSYNSIFANYPTP